jgi:hypothetical protein
MTMPSPEISLIGRAFPCSGDENSLIWSEQGNRCNTLKLLYDLFVCQAKAAENARESEKFPDNFPVLREIVLEGARPERRRPPANWGRPAGRLALARDRPSMAAFESYSGVERR